jgi:Organic solvent tolerance protein OstA
LNNLQGNVLSENKTIIEDFQKNKIELENFEYQAKKNIFKSVGNIKVIDNLNNSYEFSQIYIDEKNKEIVGTDAKLYINQKDFKFDDKNKPRVFSNAINISENKSKFIKSSFTMCDYRKGDKCPPWELSASEMTHDKKSKTIFYDNAIIKIYDIPIFYFPKLAHPDPSVDRRSGFLNPSYSDTKNLGSSLSVPYFLAIDEDRDLTINSRLFATEHPLFLGEYRQVFKNFKFSFRFWSHFRVQENFIYKKKLGENHIFFPILQNVFMTNKTD